MTNSPCLICENRHVGCHSSCEKYTDWRKIHEEEVEKEKKGKRVNQTVAEYIQESKYRSYRRKKSNGRSPGLKFTDFSISENIIDPNFEPEE